MANASARTQESPERSILTVALTALAGSSIEWYDFFIYGTAAALVFPGLFFPGFGEIGGTILSYSTFAVGFVARPPIIATSLLAATGTSLSIGVYMAVICAITGACAFLLAETYGRSMDETSEASRERGVQEELTT
jgi:hypothetical protein